MKRVILYGAAAFLTMALLPFFAFGDGMTAGLTMTEATAQENSINVQNDKKSNPSESNSTDSALQETDKIDETSTKDTEKSSNHSETQTSLQQNESVKENGVFRILNTANNEIVTVDEKEFCYGAVAYEMPPSYEKAALQAQCVACYTHFSLLRQQQHNEPDPDLNGADFKADLSKHQYYMDDSFRKEKWGNLYDSSMKALKEAVDECFGEYLAEKDDTPIDAAYFAISSGVTEDSKDVFGFESEWLKSVSSPFDKTAPDYRTTVTVSEQDFIKALQTVNKDFAMNDNPIGSIRRTKNGGSVLSAQICNCSFTGEELRRLFSLRSTCFSIQKNGDNFTFNVLGYGHNVGMSQYGANEMAKQGADYHEILQHYYNECSIKKHIAE